MDAVEEPFEISISWTKLALMPYCDLDENAVTESIIVSIEDDQNSNWELKVCADAGFRDICVS